MKYFIHINYNGKYQFSTYLTRNDHLIFIDMNIANISIRSYSISIILDLVYMPNPKVFIKHLIS